ncbi:MAG: beta-phosphoglucomutase, partial [Lachnospiraceae bacterium]|nr:beta-phosphoglucomutase [Lachnospiraceae bacterium]
SDTGMNSLNHYSYGSVMEFMYAYAAGIRADEPGYRRAVIEPHPDVRIPRLFCRYRSVSGEYVSSFCIKPDGMLDVHIEIPFGCTASVTLPEYDGPELELEAGSYDYHYKPGRDFRKRYDGHTPIVELGEDERAAGILFAKVPPIGGMAKGKDAEFGYNGLVDFRSLSFLPFEKEKLEQAIGEVSELIAPVSSLYDAVIFDLDGVICSTDKYHYEAWKELADELGIPFDLTVNDRLRGVSRMDSLEIILEKSEKEYSKSEKEAFAEQKNETYKKLLANMSEKDLSAEVRGTLDELRNRVKKLAIGSSSKNTPFILGQIGLGDYFDKVSDGNGITHSKPHPEVFLRAAELLGIRPERCLVVEDAVSGAAAGHAAGMYVACVGSASEERAGDYNLRSFSELLKFVE